jgi:phytanoyl-CoA hydroxylase
LKPVATLSETLSSPLLTNEDGEYYVKNGYVVVRGLVSPAIIDRLLDLYIRDIVPAKYPFFRQSSNAYVPNKISEHGYVCQSFLDIHDYERFPEFSSVSRDIFCSAEMMSALRRIARFDSYALMQTMFFDLNTATPGHQDWYYLDSVPNGNLIAAWIALEDIAESAGRFYVMPGTHTMEFGAKTPGRTHAEWLAIIRSYIDSHQIEVSAPALRAGDVLFWNSRTVHGSLPTRDERYSRKSLTAHYLPSGFQFGNLFSTKQDIAYKSHQGVRFYRNQPDFSRWNRLKYAIKTRTYNYPGVRETLRTLRDAISSGGGKPR